MKGHRADMAPALQIHSPGPSDSGTIGCMRRGQARHVADIQTGKSRRPRMTDLPLLAGFVTLAMFCCGNAASADYSLSGFGTVGFAKSDKSYRYQRFVDNDGTFRRDTVAGVQLDTWLTPSVGATVQALASPSSTSDEQYDATLAWAFVSWRPSNDWLFRVGKQRIPLYLHSQNQDVGVTFDFVKLPTEMYSISPGNEFNGISVTKTWSLGRGDLTVDGYLGSADVVARYWFRDGISQIQSAGSMFRAVSLSGKGVVFSLKAEESVYRLGLHRSAGKQSNGAPLPANYPFVSVMPGVGYFQVVDALPGPGIETINSIKNTIATLGIDLTMGRGFQITGEYARTLVDSPTAKIANGSDRGYLSILKKIGKWTPYVTYAFLRTDAGQRSLYQRVNNNAVPALGPDTALINASQRAGADGILTYDQHSWALGTSYTLSAKSKLKAEWMRVRIGQMSSLVDAPPGSNIRNQNINVLSLSYSVVF